MGMVLTVCRKCGIYRGYRPGGSWSNHVKGMLRGVRTENIYHHGINLAIRWGDAGGCLAVVRAQQTFFKQNSGLFFVWISGEEYLIASSTRSTIGYIFSPSATPEAPATAAILCHITQKLSFGTTGTHQLVLLHRAFKSRAYARQSRIVKVSNIKVA